MKKLKVTGKGLVFILALLIFAGLMPVRVSANEPINLVQIGMDDNITQFFFAEFTEGHVKEEVLNFIEIYSGSNFSVDPYNTSLLKKVGNDYYGVYEGHSHMDPSTEYFFRVCLEASSGYAFSETSLVVTVNKVPIADDQMRLDPFKALHITFKAPDVEQGNNILYTIKYDSNGGSDFHHDDLAVDEIPMTLSKPLFKSPAGMEFKCWAIGSPSGLQANAGDAVIFTADTTVYAIWQDLATEESETTTSTTSTTTPTSSDPTTVPTDLTTVTTEPAKVTTELTTEPTVPTTVPTDSTTEPTDPTTVTISTVTTTSPSSSKTNGIPQTGESRPIYLWGILLLISGTGLLATLFYFAKKNKS